RRSLRRRGNGMPKDQRRNGVEITRQTSFQGTHDDHLAVHAVIHASTSRSKAAPPRMGSATASLRRSLSLANKRSAESASRWAVLRLTPAQRIEGLVRRPSRKIRHYCIDGYSASRNHDAGLPSRAKVRRDSAGEKGPCQRQSSVLFSDGAVGAHSK